MKHEWVKHTITPVHTLDDQDGQPIILVDPDDQKESEENAVYGCNSCDLAFTTDNFHTECSGEYSEVAQD
jgi:hypothetical protein